MKRSEMEKLLLDGLRDLGQWYHLPPEGVARALRLLLEPKEGWDPEEPEGPGLPKRLALKRLTHEQAFQEDGWREGDIPWLIPDGEPWWTKERMFAGFEAALAAYNSENRYARVVEKALAEARRPATSFERILAILEEREPETEAPTRPGDVISKTRQGVTVHYAIGPVRETREEAEQDLRLFEERETTLEFRQVEPVAAPPEMVKAYEELRRFFFGSRI